MGLKMACSVPGPPTTSRWKDLPPSAAAISEARFPRSKTSVTWNLFGKQRRDSRLGIAWRDSPPDAFRRDSRSWVRERPSTSASVIQQRCELDNLQKGRGPSESRREAQSGSVETRIQVDSLSRKAKKPPQDAATSVCAKAKDESASSPPPLGWNLFRRQLFMDSDEKRQAPIPARRYWRKRPETATPLAADFYLMLGSTFRDTARLK